MNITRIAHGVVLLTLITIVLLPLSVKAQQMEGQDPPMAEVPFEVHVDLESLEELSDWSYIPAFEGAAHFDCESDASVFPQGEHAIYRTIVDTDNYDFDFNRNSVQLAYIWDFNDTGNNAGIASLEWSTEISEGAENGYAWLDIYCTEPEGE